MLIYKCQQQVVAQKKGHGEHKQNGKKKRNEQLWPINPQVPHGINFGRCRRRGDFQYPY